ncbi:hypothetical protein HK414_24450 [Ramlibacter terrae]|uniref:Uncharacterized protein n=1 Tax=Ramlibacter terrae TaxID=2732511 RepID=A0ABX6P5K8_9BURK|nr:hypothetical protein HK414_24450 [Ramlibacter terrae]
MPQLSVASVALLLAHHRLLADLAFSEAQPPRVPECNTREVEQCLADLRRACRELFLSPHLH